MPGAVDPGRSPVTRNMDFVAVGRIPPTDAGRGAEEALEVNILQQFALDGRVALVTGGGRGLGRAMALALASAGAGIVRVQ